jgi:hypothetical protein
VSIFRCWLQSMTHCRPWSWDCQFYPAEFSLLLGE